MFVVVKVNVFNIARLTHVASLETHMEAFFEVFFAVASHFVMCIKDSPTAVDASLFIFSIELHSRLYTFQI